MKKIKYFIFSAIIFCALVFLFFPVVLPDNQSFEGFIRSNPKEDVLIVFNSGGWGNTPIEKAKDLSPIVDGVKETLQREGYSSVVVPYERTKQGFLSKIGGAREMFSYFRQQSSDASNGIKEFLKNNPQKKVILVGLSNGASFIDEIMKKIGGIEDSVLAIEIGSPFWHKEMNSGNILRLDNGSQDSLTEGQVGILLPTLLKGPGKWFLAKISGMNLSFSNAFAFPEHKYFWDSPAVGPVIVSFLDKKI